MTAPTTRRKPAPSPPAGGRPAPAHRKPRAKLEGEARQPSESARVEALPVQHPHAAGIDIGSRSHWVCVGFATDADPHWQPAASLKKAAPQALRSDTPRAR